jgi:hypothetical protein
MRTQLRGSEARESFQAALARVVVEKNEACPRLAHYYREYGAFHREGRCIDAGGCARVSCLDASADGLCGGGLMGYADTFDGVGFDGRYSGPVKTRWWLGSAGRGGSAPGLALF